LLWQWQLLGDMMINAYYFSMSIYGWYVWTRKVDATHFTPITNTTRKENWQSLFIFIATLIFVFVVYEWFDKWDRLDRLCRYPYHRLYFLSGMWLMAQKKIENWIFWIIGDIISVPLYFYKGLTFTASFQYFYLP
jgi:nicotinamide mononucleotide transporter